MEDNYNLDGDNIDMENDNDADDAYDFRPSPLDKQHTQLVALRKLTSSGIRCILWGEDALLFAHSVCAGPKVGQTILVPDHQPERAAAILEDGKYRGFH